MDSLGFSQLCREESRSQGCLELPIRKGVGVVGDKYTERRHEKFPIKDW